eukprot:3254928-Alexandrium_andersonii.AAC.1
MCPGTNGSKAPEGPTWGTLARGGGGPSRTTPLPDSSATAASSDSDSGTLAAGAPRGSPRAPIRSGGTSSS